MNAVTKVVLVVGALAGARPAQEEWPPTFPEEIWNPHATELGVLSEVFKQQYEASNGTSFLTKRRFERADADSDWVGEQETYTFSFTSTDVCCREGGDDLYLVGIKPSGDSIVERWEFDVPAGHWVARIAGAPFPPVGTPAGEATITLQVQGGGPWTGGGQTMAPKPRIQPPNPKKTILYEGPEGPFTACEVDPEGRFLLLYDYGAKSLTRILLDGGQGGPETILTSAELPALTQVAHIEARDFADEGRKYLLRRQYPSSFVHSEEAFTICHDPDNDGNIDSVDAFGVSAFEGTPYANWADWELFWNLIQ